ncbi:MAG: hypothetical protein LBF27_05670 [Sphingobacterium sp.]|nr:hypothetical protein [Sphingobacterium sp.]
MKNITKLLLVSMVVSITSCSIKAQQAKLSNGNLRVGTINYSVSVDDESTLILINTDEIFSITRNLALKNPGKDVIPRSELKLNIPELTKIKNETIGANKLITVRFYFDTNEKLMGLAYDVNKKNDLTVEQFKKFDKEIRKTVKGSLARSFDYSTYLPYVVRSVVLK